MPYGSALMGIIGAGGGNNLVTTLYTGTALARSIVTGQNLAAGGLVWFKNRDAGTAHKLHDTERGAGFALESNTTSASSSESGTLSAFNFNGFSLGTGNQSSNQIGDNYVAWSFLQKAGFMDIVSYEGDGLSSKTISHNLTATVGAMIVKNITSGGTTWRVYHTSLGNTQALALNDTGAAATSGGFWNNTSPTTTQFTVGGTQQLNDSGDSYIAYLFAHNPAQKIFCGSFTTDGSGNATITGLGFRPKWLMAKTTNGTSGWIILDTERGWGAGNDAQLRANSNDAEILSGADYGAPTSDGFTWAVSASTTYIYMAVG